MKATERALSAPRSSESEEQTVVKNSPKTFVRDFHFSIKQKDYGLARNPPFPAIRLIESYEPGCTVSHSSC